MKIFVGILLTELQLTRLESATRGHELAYYPEANAAARKVFADSDIAFGNPPADWIAEAKALCWIQLESVGFGEYIGLNWHELGQRLRISNLAGFFSEPVAESILAGILSHYRGISRLALLQDKKQWMGEALRPELRILQGASVVFFGQGDINRRVAKLLAPFECTTTGFGQNWAAETLDRALGDADITVCTVPHTSETRGLFDRKRIGKLKSGSLLVNAGRGSLVDEDALAEALQSGALGGAVIDVTQDEPLPVEHRFWTCPNMLLTQHTGGGANDEVDRKIGVFLENFARFQTGEKPSSIVDFQRGY